MTARLARLRRLEDHARDVAAHWEAVNARRVELALDAMTTADLEALLPHLPEEEGSGPAWPVPELTGEEEDVRQWAATMSGLSRAQPWPMPPAHAPDVLADHAGRCEGLERAACMVLGELARVILEETLSEI